MSNALPPDRPPVPAAFARQFQDLLGWVHETAGNRREGAVSTRLVTHLGPAPADSETPPVVARELPPLEQVGPRPGPAPGPTLTVEVAGLVTDCARHPSPPRRPRGLTLGWLPVLVLLPPSETKHPGGDGAPLDLAALRHPSLAPVREQLLTRVESLADDVRASRAALGVSARQDVEIARNAVVRTAPTLPALDRYTGVLYDALDVRSLTRGQRARADRRLAVGSALFGLVHGSEPIPAYRLSAASQLPGLPTLRALWKPVLGPVLAATDELVVDLRSGGYADLAPVAGAVTVTVLSERADGSRSVVSHFNKAHKGRVARLLALTGAEPDTVVRLRALLRRAGLHVEHDGGTELVLVVPA